MALAKKSVSPLNRCKGCKGCDDLAIVRVAKGAVGRKWPIQRYDGLRLTDKRCSTDNGEWRSSCLDESYMKREQPSAINHHLRRPKTLFVLQILLLRDSSLHPSLAS
ncbi:unnamed protein product [Soboliphyme baturini]|uniref:4Fe-4S ferredoxin-type domain-containing protein n=1 Tax=Soboliphyme baturini TaxID=241478 RepID=A0A183IPE0_9BILA|nr:unnamed protein product [Soboliphyme baturini]